MSDTRTELRLGHLVPEFPSQTHIFFWREAAALRDLGVSVVWLSTRRPPRAIVAHVWSSEAMAATVYLSPPTPGALLRTLAELLRAPVTGAGGVAELVEDGVDGYLVAPRAPAALAQAVEDLTRDPQSARRLAAAGHHKVAAGFDSSRGAAVLARLSAESATTKLCSTCAARPPAT